MLREKKDLREKKPEGLVTKPVSSFLRRVEYRKSFTRKRPERVATKRGRLNDIEKSFFPERKKNRN